MAQVTVKKWERHGDYYDDKNNEFVQYKGYHIGHSEHGGQIIVYGSEDLVDQLITILNNAELTYTLDKTRVDEYNERSRTESEKE